MRLSTQVRLIVRYVHEAADGTLFETAKEARKYAAAAGLENSEATERFALCSDGVAWLVPPLDRDESIPVSATVDDAVAAKALARLSAAERDALAKHYAKLAPPPEYIPVSE